MTVNNLNSANKKKVYIAYTGGTIGMKKSVYGYIPVAGYITDVLNSLTELQRPEMPKFDVKEYSPVIDSSNMSPADWQYIADDIKANYQNYDGFVVLHGTDTMAYTASALSFMFDNLAKPIIVTGSQIPLSEIRSDGQHNLLNALYLVAHHPIAEVGLFFNNYLYRGNRCTKSDSAGFNAFSSPNYSELAISGIDIQVEPHRIQTESAIQSAAELMVNQITEQPIGVVSLYPGISSKVIANILAQPVNALIIQSYGVGNAPDNPDILYELKQATERGVIVVNRSQCYRGAVDMDGYATGNALKQIGVLSARDMTLESCLAKLHFILSLSLPYEQSVSLFNTNLKGEMSC